MIAKWFITLAYLLRWVRKSLIFNLSKTTGLEGKGFRFEKEKNFGPKEKNSAHTPMSKVLLYL